MSKKGKRKVEENEFYPTEREVVYSLLESDLVTLPGGTWIEPCAGTGRMISAVNERRKDVKWIMCELNNEFDPYLRDLQRKSDIILPYGDFVHREWEIPMADVLIMNPPFSLTMQFVQVALLRARIVVCLQAQGWFSGGAGRGPWLTKYCPDKGQLPWRPSFRPDGKKDSSEYCWYMWPKDSLKGRRFGMTFMLEKPTGGQLSIFGEI